ncbi:hypothetical protein KIPB_011785 [Kipferlia bialata]|uniref:Uncharacterized protein n=1 Tax=Kipferlia bialata TaxID=797122 RepID=A0A9K3D6Z9_9EUKA|nr:hypothetical protein KIPB_011785 [Kipferlia bialata]|eukprot:g11785.t1
MVDLDSYSAGAPLNPPDVVPDYNRGPKTVVRWYERFWFKFPCALLFIAIMIVLIGVAAVLTMAGFYFVCIDQQYEVSGSEHYTFSGTASPSVDISLNHGQVMVGIDSAVAQDMTVRIYA